jgi:uracil DNA glycosylase
MTSVEIKEKIAKYLKGTEWDNALETYWKSDEFEQTLDTLVQYTKINRPFTPTISNVFRFLKECPYNTIKAVLFIDDSCNTLRHTGIAYSQDHERMTKPEFPKNENERVCRRSDVEYFLRDLIKVDVHTFNYNLTRWCNQGVLIVPYTLTARIDNSPHYDLWREFRIRLIDSLNINHKNIPWLLVGDRTIKMEGVIESRNIALFDMNFSADRKSWHEGINQVLRNQNKEPIKWI